MPQLTVGDMTLEVNEDGFILEPDRWNDEVAAALAAADGVGQLTAKHWKIVRYVRGHYVEFHVPPLVRKLCRQTGIPLKEIYELFPGGPAKGACKVAGLPSAKGCV
ncbi:MAG: TusE/DsrC/DsvC family sulfur relay protein [Acidobacteria bacterium]|nr:TusE/DsrC/DsvC family sulfur relay protein [Acidobacteriota bacterium]